MQPLLKQAPETTQLEANEPNIECSQQQADLEANPERDFPAPSVETCEEKIILVNKEDAASVASVAVSYFPSHGYTDSNRDTEQASFAREEEAPSMKPQNGIGKEKQKECPSAPGLRQLFPPGRIIHMVAQPSPDPDPGEGSSNKEIIGIYETPRELYAKIRLAPNMVNEHYMPSYISTMESLLEQLNSNNIVSTTTLNDL
jgi:hypothetical protein